MTIFYTFSNILLFLFHSLIDAKASFFVQSITNILIKIYFNPKFYNSTGGPGSLLRGLIESAQNYNRKCSFEKWSCNYSEIEKNNIRKHFYYLPDPPNFCQTVPEIYKRTPGKLTNTIFGPFLAPTYWNYFPNKRICHEKNFSRTLDLVGTLVVHSDRVRDHIVRKSGTHDKAHKIEIMRACSNLTPEKIKPFSERKIDLIFYEKYADSDRKKDGFSLYNSLLKKNFSIKRISYGGTVEGAPKYNHSSLKVMANDSKFIIYYSFWDTGAISLKEIQNFGVFTFSVQKDLVHNQTGIFVKELNKNVKKAAKIISKKMNEIMKSGLDAVEIANINQYKNSCQRSLDDLCNIAIKKLS